MLKIFRHDRPAALLLHRPGRDAFVHYIDVRDLARAFGWRWSTPRSTRAPTSSPRDRCCATRRGCIARIDKCAAALGCGRR
ncbi:MAG: hypothetical protein U1F77_03040 [Kiritimatiellia bacterium]